MTVIRITEGAQLVLRVLEVALELKLFVLGEPDARFDAAAGQSMPREFPLDASLTYDVRYDNNNGGPGVLHFQIVDTRQQKILFEMNRNAITGPVVVEVEFSFSGEDPVAKLG